ncbi:hypothetical protein [Actinomadura macra]|uniref:hypothetical protein n=1 Tax=Actinomadura macra TaxID=46164 RepID=UPI000B0182DC|nr:hypothetical protein [Actinomadura macra]
MRGDLVYMTWKGVDGDQRILFSRRSGVTWTPPQSIPGANTSFRPALATTGD